MKAFAAILSVVAGVLMLGEPAHSKAVAPHRDCTDHFSSDQGYWTVFDRGASWLTMSPSNARLIATISYTAAGREKFATEGFFAEGVDASVLLHPAAVLGKADLWIEIRGRKTVMPPIRVGRRSGALLPVSISARQISPLLREGGPLVFTLYDWQSRLVDRIGLEPKLLNSALVRLQTMARNYPQRLADPEKYCPVPEIIIAN